MNLKQIEGNLIVKLTFEFSLELIKYCELLETNRRYVIFNQLLKSGTSIGANVWEAQNSESKFDFIHKFKIAAKESDETKYWLLVCKYSCYYPDPNDLLERLDTIEKIITRIISSSKKSLKQN